MMNNADKLGGFIAQSMGGPKVLPVECTQFAVNGTRTFTAPRNGWYKFVAWGAGGAGAGAGAGGGGGGSGAYGEITKYLGYGQSVTVAVGAPGGGSTVLTFPDGTTATATGGSNTNSATGGVGGTATGFDVNINGSAGGTGPTGAGGNGGGTGGGAGSAAGPGGAGGAGAPANLPYFGAPGVSNQGANINVWAGPGAGQGGWVSGSAGQGAFAGCGLAIVQFVRPF